MSEFGRLNSAVDQMFDQVERKPFSAFSPNAVIAQDSDIPLMPAGVAQDIALPQYLQFGISGGIQNGNFEEGPEDGHESVIDNISNKLPGWSFVDNGNPITCKWYGTGVVTFFADDGALTDDTAYLETIAPVTQIGRILRPSTTVTNTASVDATMVVQFLDISGGELGTAATSYITGLPYDRVLDQWVTPQWGAEQYIRVRLGVKLLGDISSLTALTTYSKAWLEPPAMYDVTLNFWRSAFDPDADTTYSIRTNEDVVFGVGSYIATGDGFLMAYSGQTDASISAGKAQVYLRNSTQSTNIYLGNDVAGTYFSNSASDVRAERLLTKAPQNTSPYDFVAGDELQLRFDTNGSWSSGTGDWNFHVRLLQAFGEEGSAWTIAS